MSVAQNEQDGARRFVVTLWVDEGRQTSIRSCEVQSSSFRSRISFTDENDMHHVLHARLATKIARYLDEVLSGTRIMVVPDLVVDLPNLAFRGMHMLATAMENGMQQVIVRFGRFIGRLEAAFKDQSLMFNIQTSHISQTALDILTDIAMPLFNLSRVRVENPDDIETKQKLEHALTTLRDKSYELEFYVEMLKRFAALDQPDDPALAELSVFDDPGTIPPPNLRLAVGSN